MSDYTSDYFTGGNAFGQPQTSKSGTCKGAVVDLDDIAEAQGWTDSALLTMLTDFLHLSASYEAAVQYAQQVYEEENSLS